MFLYVRSYFINPRINLSQRNWVLASNSNFPISISLQPNVVNLRNFKLTDFSILVISEWLLVTSSSGTGRYGTGRYGTGRYGGKECTGVQEGRYWRIPIEYPCFLRFYSVPIGVAPHYLNGELHFLLQDRVCLVHSNPFLEADRVENRYLRILVSIFLCFLWREVGEEMEKDPKLWTIFSVSYSRVWESILIFFGCIVLCNLTILKSSISKYEFF